MTKEELRKNVQLAEAVMARVMDEASRTDRRAQADGAGSAIRIVLQPHEALGIHGALRATLDALNGSGLANGGDRGPRA